MSQNTGDAALHLAAALNRPNSVKELADSGANMKVINKVFILYSFVYITSKNLLTFACIGVL